MKNWRSVDLISMGRENLRIGRFETAKKIGQAGAQHPQFPIRAGLIGEAIVARRVAADGSQI